MIKDPAHPDVMGMLVALAHRPDKDASLRRIRFEAAFSACHGQVADHPAIAITWLWKLHHGVAERYQGRIRKSCRTAFNNITRESAEKTMILAAAMVNDSPSGSLLQKCATDAFTKALHRALKGNGHTDRTMSFFFKAVRQIDNPAIAQSLKKTATGILLELHYGTALKA